MIKGLMSIADNTRHRPEIQLLRGVAVILVVVAHSGMELMSGGYIGVDVFFVISGFLITRILVEELERSGTILIRRFMLRRLKRLLPALTVMVVATSALSIWLFSAVEAKAQTGSAMYALAWVSNVYFAFREISYFDQLSGKDLFLHTWSLGVEEQFYLFWPCMLLIVYKLTMLSRNGQYRLPVYYLCLFGLMICVSAYFNRYWLNADPLKAFYLMPARIWEFMVGAVCYSLVRYRPNYQTFNRFCADKSAVIFAVGITMILASALILDPTHRTNNFWLLIPCTATMLIIIAGHEFPSSSAFFGLRILEWIGDRSYSIYLWHWPIVIISGSLGFSGSWPFILSQLGLILFLGSASYKYVELPFWKARTGAAGSELKSLLLHLLILVFAVSIVFHLTRGLPSASNAPQPSNVWRNDVGPVYNDLCDSSYRDAELNPCVYGNPLGAKTLIIFGDSMGVQWASGFDSAFPDATWKRVVLTKSSCPIVDEDYYLDTIGQVFDLCREWRNSAIRYIQAMEPDVIILGSSSFYDFSASQWAQGSRRILSKLDVVSGDVYVIPGSPSLGFDGPGCLTNTLSKKLPENEQCIALGRVDKVQAVLELLRTALVDFENVHLLDLNSVACPDQECRVRGEDGIVRFRDSQHLTNSYVVSMQEKIADLLYKSKHDRQLKDY